MQVCAWVSCTFYYNISTPFVHNEYRIVIKGGLTSMITQWSNEQQGLIETWKKMCFVIELEGLGEKGVMCEMK